MFSGLNSEKRNTEYAKNYREPQRNRSFSFRHLFLSFSSNPSALSVVFLGVLCVKFRKISYREHKESRREEPFRLGSARMRRQARTPASMASRTRRTSAS